MHSNTLPRLAHDGFELAMDLLSDLHSNAKHPALNWGVGFDLRIFEIIPSLEAFVAGLQQRDASLPMTAHLTGVF